MKIEKSSNQAEVKAIYKTKVKAKDRPKITNSMDAVNQLKQVYDADQIELREEAVILLLNRKNHVLGFVRASTGGLAGTVMDQRIIFSTALAANASAIIISHNHPSGNTKPSQADINITRKIKECGELLEIPLLDHIIITPEYEFFSFADEQMM